jgi:hypothetical protein
VKSPDIRVNSRLPAEASSAKAGQFAVSLCLLLCCVECMAAGEAAPAPSPAKDYGAGFAQLYKLGLPDVAGAKYVALDLYGGSFEHDSLSYQTGVKGSSWLLKEIEPGRGLFVIGGARVAEVYDMETLQKLQAAEAKKAAEAAGPDATSARMMFPGIDESGRVSGKWRAAQLDKDAGKIIAFLEKQQKGERLESNLQYGGMGRLFLFAAHVYKSGLTNQANRIVDLLFEKAGDGRRVIVQGVEALADAQYQDVYAAFGRTRDWKAFQRALDELLARHKGGWKMRGSVERLAGEVKTRIETPEAPPVSGEGVTEEDQALLKELEAKPSRLPSYYGRGDLWILPKVQEESPVVQMQQAPALQAIKDRGMKSVPLLLAMVGDTRLTEWPSEAIRGNRYFSYSYSGAGVTEEIAEQQYRNMNRPATRSDIARSLLEPLVASAADRSRSSDQLSDEEFRDEARAWYEEHKDQAPEQLAFGILEQENPSAKGQAIDYLLKHLPKEKLTGLEKYLVDEETPGNSMSLVQQYAEARGPEAKEFVEKFAARLQEESDDQPGSGNEEYRVQMQRQLSNQVAQIRNLVSGKPFEELLADVAAGKEKPDAVYPGLSRRLQKETPAGAVDLLLPWAVKAGTPAAREWFVRGILMQPQLAQFSYLASMPEGQEGYYGAFGRQKPVELEATRNADDWKTLMKDERLLASSTYGIPYTVADHAAWTVEMLYDPAHAKGSGAVVNKLGRRGLGLIRARAAARVDGKPDLPPYPDPSGATPERRAAILADLEKAGSGKAAELVRDLPLHEQVFLFDEARTNKTVSRTLVKEANVIRDVRAEDVAGADVDALRGALAGKPFDAEALRKVAEFCKGRASGEGPILVTALREPCLEGCSVTVAKRPEEMQPSMYSRGNYSPFGFGQAPTAPVNATAVLPGGARASASWEAGAKSAAAPKAPRTIGEELAGPAAELFAEMVRAAEEGTAGHASADSNEDFWKKVADLEGGVLNALETAAVYFTVVPPKQEDGKEE